MYSEQLSKTDKMQFLNNNDNGLMYNDEGAKSIWETNVGVRRPSKAKSDMDMLNLPYKKK